MEKELDKMATVADLLARAEAAELAGVDAVRALGLSRAAAAYNGIGPAYMGERLRARVTAYLGVFAPAAMIHDCRYELSDGSREAFVRANREFLVNCIALADREYAWWSWRRYRARAVAQALYDFVSSPAGWRAWEEAANSEQ